MTDNEGQAHDLHDLDQPVPYPGVEEVVEEHGVSRPSDATDQQVIDEMLGNREWLSMATHLADIATENGDFNALSEQERAELVRFARDLPPAQLDELCSVNGAKHVREVLGIPVPEQSA